MKNHMTNLFAERIAAGLQRRSLTTCSRWARACRVMGRPYPGKFSFKWHPWLKEMHDSEAEVNIGMKSAQMGYTEWALNTTFFNIDVKSIDTLYVLPAQTPDATDFSASRFDPALEMSPHLSKLFSEVKNIGHKRAGTTNLYVRGSRARAGLKSIPVGLIILDEVDEMEQANIPLALERASGQVEKKLLAISTPTIANHGISKMYNDTTMEHFFFKCPHCTRLTELIFPDCLVITAEDLNDRKLEQSHLICKECKGVLEHKTKHSWLATGIWVPENSERAARGFHINQLYSSTVEPWQIAFSHLKAERDPSEEQELWNSKLGLPHVVKGAGVTDTDLDNCLGGYKKYLDPPNGGWITMGVDVGTWLHYEIDHWYVPGNIRSTDLNVQSKCKVLTFGKVHHFEELDILMYKWKIQGCVIDANPERRKAYEFAARHHGLVKMCFYAVGVAGKQIHISKTEEPTISVDRTSWLDLALGRFRGTGMINIPMDVDLEYRSHMKALVRRYEKDPSGNQIGKYIKADNDPDHYAHARNYAELALPVAMSLVSSRDITEQV